MLHAESGEGCEMREAEGWCGWNRNAGWRAAYPASLLSSVLSSRCEEKRCRIDTGYRTPDADRNEGEQAVLQRCAWPIPPRDPAGVRMKTPMPVGRGADVAWRGEGGLGSSSASRAAPK